MNLYKYLQKAQKEKWAIGQFNFSTFSQLQGIIKAAEKLKSPVILGTSEGESGFLGLKQVVDLKNLFQKESKIPIFLNLDHGKSFQYLKESVDAGYDAVHFDGSKLPIKENIKKTKEVIKYAKRRGVLVEGEVGIIGTEASKIYKEKLKIKAGDLTNPKEAGQYIRETGVDCLAVSIGNFHGMEKGRKNPKLRLEELNKIRKETGDKFLVLHGGSGISDEDIKKSIKLGIVKININTELRLAFTESLKKELRENPEEITPYKYLPNVVMAVQKVVEGKIELFGSKKKAI